MNWRKSGVCEGLGFIIVCFPYYTIFEYVHMNVRLVYMFRGIKFQKWHSIGFFPQTIIRFSGHEHRETVTRKSQSGVLCCAQMKLFILFLSWLWLTSCKAAGIFIGVNFHIYGLREKYGCSGIDWDRSGTGDRFQRIEFQRNKLLCYKSDFEPKIYRFMDFLGAPSVVLRIFRVVLILLQSYCVSIASSV